MDETEVISGNCDPLVEFSDTMFQWYLSYQTSTKTAPKGLAPKGPSAESLETQIPLDSSPYWIIHVLESSERLPGAGRLHRANISPLKTDEYMGKSVVMVTDASGLALGFGVLPRDWHWFWYDASGESEMATQIICTVVKVLQRCTEAPMCGGPPRRPDKLKTTDRLIHSLFSVFSDSLQGPKWSLSSPFYEQFNPKPNQQWVRGLSLRWPPVYYCNACKTKSFPTRLKECSRCAAVYFCEDGCVPKEEHEAWCQRLRQYMLREAWLGYMPFSYNTEVTSRDFSLEEFLSEHRLDRGYWLALEHAATPAAEHNSREGADQKTTGLDTKS
ncbi:hypothetical protein NL108_011333 [Boleophthalmus pectinirostris]|nr:hypothetical protein NL108_011333 [Boleophthalmus pectinirostris]